MTMRNPCTNFRGSPDSYRDDRRIPPYHSKGDSSPSIAIGAPRLDGKQKPLIMVDQGLISSYWVVVYCTTIFSLIEATFWVISASVSSFSTKDGPSASIFPATSNFAKLAFKSSIS